MDIIILMVLSLIFGCILTLGLLTRKRSAPQSAEDMRAQIIFNRRNARIRGGYQPLGGGKRPDPPTTGSCVRKLDI